MRLLVDADLPRPTADVIIVVFGLPQDANRDTILRLVDAFLTQTDVLERLPGRRAIVEPGRIRLRPA